MDQAVVQALVIPLVVVVGDELADGTSQRALADENHALEAGLFDRADEAFGVGIQVRRAGGEPDGPHMGRGECVPHSRTEQRVTVVDKEPHVSQKSVLGIGGVPHELGDPGASWLGADAGDLDATAGQLNQHQHREAGQAARRPDLDGEEVGGGEDVPVAARNSRQVVCFRRSGAGSRPCALSTVAMVPRATWWPRLSSAPRIRV